MDAGGDEAFDAVGDALLGEPGVEEGTGFGSNPGLRVGGKIFAMVFRGELVVKLPPDRVAQLVGSGDAHAFTVGERRMREWATVPPGGPDDWADLAREALAFVGGRQVSRGAAPRAPRATSRPR